MVVFLINEYKFLVNYHDFCNLWPEFLILSEILAHFNDKIELLDVLKQLLILEVVLVEARNEYSQALFQVLQPKTILSWIRILLADVAVHDLWSENKQGFPNLLYEI